MHVGVPREIKTLERRVALTPDAAAELVAHGHTVTVETNAGAGSGYSDEDYTRAGAQLVMRAADVWAEAELVLKVKEPQPSECVHMRAGQALFTYLHLAAEPALARMLAQAGVTAIAYETVTDREGRLPLLAPMSEIAGRLAVQAGAWFACAHLGGSGRLLGGVAGVPPASVLVLGGGVAGSNAAAMAVGLGARVTVVDRSIDVLRALDARWRGRVTTQYSTAEAIRRAAREADLVIGAVLIRGARAPRLLQLEDVSSLRPGTVLVDVAIDQGGCFATSRPTTHDAPTYDVGGVLHYCVANMPGAMPATATAALVNATLPYVLALADRGIEAALAADPGLAEGLAVRNGDVVPEEIRALLGEAA